MQKDKSSVFLQNDLRPEKERLKLFGIHIWHARIADLLNLEQDGLVFLDCAEKERMRLFSQNLRAVRFGVCRLFAKKILCLYTKKSPDEIHFTYGRYGKPYCLDACFSLAHTDEDTVICLADENVGIDIEEANPKHFTENSDAFFDFLHPDEKKVLSTLCGHERGFALRTLWIRKEAIVKAQGHSILREAHTICVSHRSAFPWGRWYSAKGDLCSEWFCPLIEYNNCAISVAVRSQYPLRSLSFFSYPSALTTSFLPLISRDYA